jgi:hypothetical protein
MPINPFGFNFWAWARRNGVIWRLNKEEARREFAGKVVGLDCANLAFSRPERSRSVDDSIHTKYWVPTEQPAPAELA